MREAEQKFAHWLVNNRRWSILAVVLFSLLACSGLYKLTIDSDLRVFFSDTDPQLLALKALENTYVKNESIIFIVLPKKGDIFERDALQVVTELTQDAWQIPFSNRVDSITNYQYSFAQGDELIVSEFIDDLSHLSDIELDIKRKIALQEDRLLGRLIREDLASTVVVANIVFSSKTPEEISQVAEFSRHLVTRFQNDHPNFEFYLTGSVMFDTAFSEVGQRDMRVMAPLIFLILAVVMLLATRSVMATCAVMLVVLLSMLSALGIAGWLGISINPASANAPTIILTLAIADSVHILVAYYRSIYLGKQKLEAIEESMELNLQAVFLTSLTTVVGFLSMNFSESPPFNDLGNIVAIGITAAFFYSLFLLPTLISFIPVSTKQAPIVKSQVLFGVIARFVTARSMPILLTMGLLVVVGGLFAFKNVLNDNWIRYFDGSIPVRTATDLMEKYLGGSDYMEYSLPAKEGGTITDPEYLLKLDEFTGWLRLQPEVAHVHSISDIFKRLNKNMHADNQEFYRLPHSRNLAAQYLLLYEMSLPQGLDLTNQINVDRSASRIVVSVKNLGTRALRLLDERVRQWLIEHTPDHMHIRGTGLSVVWAYLSGRNIQSMLVAAFTAVFIISGILIISLRSITLGFISLVPNLTPAILGFGIWALMDGEVGLGLSVVVGMTLGIIVDDTVHFVSKYSKYYQEITVDELNRQQRALEKTFLTVGPAMTLTTIALVLGFLVLTLSDYKMSADMGILSAITVALAWLMDLLLLPALILLTSRREYR